MGLFVALFIDCVARPDELRSGLQRIPFVVNDRWVAEVLGVELLELFLCLGLDRNRRESDANSGKQYRVNFGCAHHRSVLFGSGNRYVAARRRWIAAWA